VRVLNFSCVAELAGTSAGLMETTGVTVRWDAPRHETVLSDMTGDTVWWDASGNKPACQRPRNVRDDRGYPSVGCTSCKALRLDAITASGIDASDSLQHIEDIYPRRAVRSFTRETIKAHTLTAFSTVASTAFAEHTAQHHYVLLASPYVFDL